MKKRLLIKVVIVAAFGMYAYFRAGDRMQQRIAARSAAARPAAGATVNVTAATAADGKIVRSGEVVPAEACTREIVKISDGDTLILDGNEKVRLLGVDTPEKYESGKLDKQAAKLGAPKKALMRLGEQASEYAKKLCAGRKCRIVVAGTGQKPKDDYGRTLAYVYLDNGLFLNAELIKQGFATAYDHFNYSQRGYFQTLERNARQNKRGLWCDPLFVRLADE